MKTMSINIPDNMANQIKEFVKTGFFATEPDVIMAAMTEFLRRNRIEMMERFAREDIEWAKNDAQDMK
jgi:Arc/MetJ-type ribon-helix-helix transcriptional regulator